MKLPMLFVRLNESLDAVLQRETGQRLQNFNLVSYKQGCNFLQFSNGIGFKTEYVVWWEKDLMSTPMWNSFRIFFHPPHDDSEETRKIRHQRIEKTKNKCARIMYSIWIRFKEIKQLEEELKPYEGDIALATQPGHIPLRERLNRKKEKIFRLRKEIRELEEKLKNTVHYKTRIKGDAEKAYQEKREENDKVIDEGTQIQCALYGEGKVVKVNKKTYKVDFGHCIVNIDKWWASPIEGGD